MAYHYAFRAQKSLGLVACDPPTGSYATVSSFADPGVPAREITFSPARDKFAYILPSSVSIFKYTESGEVELHQELANTSNIIEIHFSPQGTWLATWERPKKLEDPSAVHKNLRIFKVETGEEVFGLSQKGLGDHKEWDLQYTDDEAYAVRMGGGGEIQIYVPGQWDKGLRDKAKVDGASSVHLSHGKNPHVAVFVKERKGAPASFKLYSLTSLMGGSGTAPIPISQKTFYKADRATVKWNALGTQVLLLTQTDVDNTNKSYYGETGLYLLSAAGNFDARLTLDREGPIHDFAWSPSSKEFGVVYGYMPAKTTLFSTRLQSLFDFPPSPTNFISFSPDTRFLILAGFGNLAGNIAIYERRNPGKMLTKVEAPNTTACEWSPDGRFLMTSTFSPRLRVDNMIKLWHMPSGQLVHVQETDELYWAAWRPSPFASAPLTVDVPPPPSTQALGYFAAKSKSKSPSPGPSTPTSPPAGAYRPPGARGTATPAIYKREDEGGVARLPGASGSGASTPRGRRSPERRERTVPGSAAYGNGEVNGGGGKRRGPPPGSAPVEGGKGGRKKGPGPRDKERPGKKAEKEKEVEVPVTPPPTSPPPTANGTGETGEGELDTVQKKVRNLNKKLKAIEELKARHARGDKLEATQIRKMEGEQGIRDELVKLGGN